MDSEITFVLYIMDPTGRCLLVRVQGQKINLPQSSSELPLANKEGIEQKWLFYAELTFSVLGSGKQNRRSYFEKRRILN